MWIRTRIYELSCKKSSFHIHQCDIVVRNNETHISSTYSMQKIRIRIRNQKGQTYCTCWLNFPLFKTVRNHSKMVALALGKFLERKAPTSCVKPMVISNGIICRSFKEEDKDLESNNFIHYTSNWLTRWARKVVSHRFNISFRRVGDKL